MTPEFDRVREAFASSLPGRVLAGTQQALASGWRSSRFASAMRAAVRTVPPPIDRVRAIAIAIAIAAALQPPLIVMMPRTARPWMPWIVFVVIALIAAAAAWRPSVIAASWPQSWLARRLRR
jgi:hypothetical protein